MKTLDLTKLCALCHYPSDEHIEVKNYEDEYIIGYEVVCPRREDEDSEE